MTLALLMLCSFVGGAEDGFACTIKMVDEKIIEFFFVLAALTISHGKTDYSCSLISISHLVRIVLKGIFGTYSNLAHHDRISIKCQEYYALF